MGGAGVAYLGVREGHFEEDFKARNIHEKLAWIIKKEKPSKIFTHGIDDFHPDHRAVNHLVMQLIGEKKITCPVYSFEVWSLVKLRNRNLPRLVVDIGDTFNTKIKAFLVHESQTLAIWSLLWKLILKDWLSGLVHGYKYAEVFYKLK
jgi:LmbE family N-acetylglucosaminyl deacetylase